MTMNSQAAFSFQSSSPFQSSKVTDVSIEDYTRFHAMLCGASASSRCLNSFDGTILFGSHEYYSSGKELATFDYSRTRFGLNLITYYILVVFSLTGLSTLLGRTHLRRQRQESKIFISGDESADIKSEAHKELRVPPHVIDYILEQSRLSGQKSSSEVPELKLTQRFEFEFADDFCSVLMLHFRCSYGKKHLVEVYKLKTSLSQKLSNYVWWIIERFNPVRMKRPRTE
jgi:hypothetical protein